MQPRLLREPVRLAGLPLLRMQSDERLIRLAREGHPPAFSAIVDRYRPGLLRYCTRLVGEQRAEDAVQQALVNAHRALTEHDAEVADLRPWLYRIAHNAAMNTLRGDTEGWSLDDPAAAGEGLARPGDDVAATVEQREQLHRALAVISGLPTAQRDALLLRELEGRSHAEIAGALGVSAGAARQHLMRARAAVRAAAAAVTPYPLLQRVAGWMTLTPTGERVSQAAAGAGLGAGLAKVSAGVLATSALVGGAAVGTGVAPSPLHPHHAAVAAASAAAGPAAPVTPPVPAASPSAGGHATFAVGTTTGASGRHRTSATARSRRHDGSVALGRGGAQNAGSGSSEDRRTASSGHGDPQSTSGGSDSGNRESVRLPARTSAEHTDGEVRRTSTTAGSDASGSSSHTTTTLSSGSSETSTGVTSGSSGDGGGSTDPTDSGGPTATTDLAAPTSPTGDHTVTSEPDPTG